MSNYDFIVIGSGPAGLAAAQYGARFGLKTLVLEADSSGGQVMQITQLENYPGMGTTDGKTFTDNMRKMALDFGAEIKTEKVVSLDKIKEEFQVHTKNETYTSLCVLLATGAVHRTLEVKGEKELNGRGVSYCAVCDGPFFKGKKILVVGGGDSACAEAIYLSSISKDVTLIHRRDELRAQKAVVEKMLAAGVKVKYDTVITEISGKNFVEQVTFQNTKTGAESTEKADAVFIFTGMEPQTELIDFLQKDKGGYIITDENMATLIPGLFAAGDVRSKPLRQIVTAVSDGATAAYSAKEYIYEKNS
ncbi:MAG: thioredoxin-disulfide reductase [Treponema sp.]|nr:thioredoxin-disulfide reductase [Treponema sp.]